MRYTKKNSHDLKGFTLIELMIVVAIIAIIAMLAYPSYISYITRTNRVAAEGCVSQYSSYMERFYTSNMRYDQDQTGTLNTLPAIECANSEETGANYGYTLTNLTQSTYTITASPTGTQSTRDTLCENLSLDQSANKTISGSGVLSQCW